MKIVPFEGFDDKTSRVSKSPKTTKTTTELKDFWRSFAVRVSCYIVQALNSRASDTSFLLNELNIIMDATDYSDLDY